MISLAAIIVVALTLLPPKGAPEGSAAMPSAAPGYLIAASSPLLETSASAQLVFSTYLGGDGVEEARAIAVDGNGHVYVGGLTASPGLPATSGSFDTTLGGEFDGFIAKLNATGTVEFITYIGGTGSDIVLDVAIDDSGNVVIGGSTDSTDFPTTVDGLDRSYNGGRDGFLAKLSGDGTALLYATYLGGSGRDEAAHIALGTGGGIYLAGPTFSFDFPTTPGAYDPAIVGGLENIFVSRLDLNAGVLVFSTYLEGVWDDSSTGLAVDAAGAATVVGWTDSQDFPTTPTAFDATVAGRDGFVVRLSVDGSSLLYGSFLGGSNSDLVTAAAVGANGVVYATGYTASTDFPTTAAALSRSYRGGVFDAFMIQLDPQGGLLYSSYVGGTGDDAGKAIATDASGATYVLGYTNSVDFPTTSAAISTVHSGFADAFLLSLGGSGLSYSTYFGGSGSDLGEDLALDSDGNLYLTGGTDSTDLLVAGGASDTTLDGFQDAFLAKARIPKPDAPAPTFPWLLVIVPVTGGLGVAAAAILLRSRRQRKEPHFPETEGPGQ